MNSGCHNRIAVGMWYECEKVLLSMVPIKNSKPPYNGIIYFVQGKAEIGLFKKHETSLWFRR